MSERRAPTTAKVQEMIAAGGGGGISGIDIETATATDSQSINSTSYVDIPNMSIIKDIKDVNSVVFISFSFTIMGTGDRSMAGGIFVDGVLKNEVGEVQDNSDEWSGTTVTFVIKGLSAGNHTFKGRGKCRSSAVTVSPDSLMRCLQVVEYKF